MVRFPIAGTVILVILSILVYLGLLHRVLDRMRLGDRTALTFIVAMLAGQYLPAIPLPGDLAINVGGGLIPLVLAGYLLVTAGHAAEATRGALAAVVVAALILFFDRVYPIEPGTGPFIIDPVWLAAILAAAVGYLLGRSRRAAFTGAVLGVVLADVSTAALLRWAGVGTDRVLIGGAGVFDVTVVAGTVAVLLAEVVGEVRERLSRD